MDFYRVECKEYLAICGPNKSSAMLQQLSCQQIPLFSISLSMLWLVVPLTAGMNASTNQSEECLHSGLTVDFLGCIKARPEHFAIA